MSEMEEEVITNVAPDENEEELLGRHRKEKKDLQAKIQQIKKASKDKKNKKEATTQIAQLEEELKQRHAKELSDLKEKEEVDCVTNGVAEVSVAGGDDEADDDDDARPEQGAKKVSKAEKRRQKKAQANREREARIKEAEKDLKYSARNIETEKMRKILLERKLRMHEIQPDGNCMYAAIAHQMGSETTVAKLRGLAGQFIRSHADDFTPFITDPNTGDMLTPEQFEEYCSRVEHTPAWGGQPELRALSQVMKRRIEVLQAEGTPVIFGEECSKEDTIQLAYYRHYYGLGEHYNSVVKFVPEPTQDQE